MQDENLSQWFNLDEQKPWEHGVYEVEYRSGAIGCAYFNGEEFAYGWAIGSREQNIKDAFLDRNEPFNCRPVRWRGLASDPSAKPKPKARGNRKVTRYVVAETVGLYTSHIDPNAIHGVYTSQVLADGVAQKLRSSGHFMARVFRTKRFRSPDGA